MVRHDIYRRTKPLSSVLTFRNQSPKARKLFYSSAIKNFEVRYFAILGYNFCVAGRKAVNFFENPVNIAFTLPHKDGGKSFFS